MSGILDNSQNSSYLISDIGLDTNQVDYTCAFQHAPIT